MMYLAIYLLFTTLVFCQDLETEQNLELDELEQLELEEEQELAKVDPHNYYNYVGKCDKVIGRADTSFYTPGVAGQGDFYYYRSNDIKKGVGCGILNINDAFSYRSYTVFNAKFLHGKTHTYKLHDYSKGVVLEDEVQDPRNPNKVFTFKLIFVHYDDLNGVLAYIRCSDFGRRKNFVAYSVLIKASVWKNPIAVGIAKAAADKVVTNDGMNGQVNFVGTSKCP